MSADERDVEIGNHEIFVRPESEGFINKDEVLWRYYSSWRGSWLLVDF